MFKSIIISIIKLYQKTLSLDHGPLKEIYLYQGCRFRPTCSEYALEAIKEYGVVKGVWLGIKRVFRCHPLNRGGWDPLR